MNAADPLFIVIRNLNENSAVLNGINLPITKSSGVIRNVLLPCFLKDLIKDLESSYFSFIIEGSTVIDTMTVLYITIRYFSRYAKKLKTKFYRLSQIEADEANTILDSFKSQLTRDSLNLEKVIGINELS